MNTFIVLLKGINVGGKNIIKMEQLRAVLHKHGYQDIQTYIQSGNVILKSDMVDSKDIAYSINEIILEEFELNISVIALEANLFKNITQNAPFQESPASKTATVYLFFTNKTIQPESIDLLNSFLQEGEQILINHTVIYLYLPQGYSNTKLSNPFLEKKLKTTGTTRNLSTCQRLVSLSS